MNKVESQELATQALDALGNKDLKVSSILVSKLLGYTSSQDENGMWVIRNPKGYLCGKANPYPTYENDFSAWEYVFQCRAAFFINNPNDIRQLPLNRGMVWRVVIDMYNLPKFRAEICDDSLQLCFQRFMVVTKTLPVLRCGFTWWNRGEW